tara:strand:- start:33 stop:221 length:189 start_codon:yes stop_codon:yes gene_type:complete
MIMNNMNITSAKYYADITGTNVAISATIDGQTMSVPLDPDNRHYAEILKQVKEGKLTIKDAD